MPIRATNDPAALNDPYTGLVWPNRFEKAEVVATEGLPIGATLDWVTLSFQPTIEVPGDAWVDWDAVNQKWITASEKYTETQTAQVKTVVYYPADLWEKITWHDGSPITIADFMMAMIMGFDTGKPDSLMYDEAAGENLAAFLDHFKGVKIISTDPLVIETYDDLWLTDAELNVTTWWPAYTYGPGAWHNIAVGTMAEAEKALAFSADKAEAEEIEWMSFISGPSLEVLKGYLDKAVAENYIPFAPTMSEYLSAEEATARWANLAAWYEAHGHFWLGTGPFYVYKVFPVEGTLMLQRYTGYPDLANRWDRFGEPAIATVEVDGPGQVTIGGEATFDVFVTFKDAPYPQKDINEVKYLVFDAKGALVATGTATAVADGQYQVVLTAEMTKALEAGANRLEIAVSPIVVSVPSFATFEFVTVP
jgi:peptide/nickel transport system substrate-binding protein